MVNLHCSGCLDSIQCHVQAQYFLDVGFVAKVADFGFVTPLPAHVGSTSLITVAGAVGLAGTRGYLAPEFTDGK